MGRLNLVDLPFKGDVLELLIMENLKPVICLDHIGCDIYHGLKTKWMVPFTYLLVYLSSTLLPGISASVLEIVISSCSWFLTFYCKCRPI